MRTLRRRASVKLGATVDVPLSTFERGELAKLKKRLTYKYMPYGGDKPITLYGYRERGEVIQLPRDFGIQYATEKGISYPRHGGVIAGNPWLFEEGKPITLRPKQVPFVQGIMDAFQEHPDLRVEAHTGFGKTVCACEVARRLEQPTLIIVDQNNLKTQWLESITDTNLLALPEDCIGLVQGKTLDWENRSMVIAMAQTLAQKRMPEAFYSYFGLVIYDEGHTTSGADTYSKALFDISSRYRLSVSATPDRKDGYQQLIEDSLGPVRVEAKAQHDKSEVWYLTHPTVYSWYANHDKKAGRMMTEIKQDGSRNIMIAEVVRHFYENESAEMLVIGATIDHLQSVMYMCEMLGVPEEDMALYTGKHYVWKYAKEPKPARRPANLEPGAEYTPVSYQCVSVTTKKKELEGMLDARIIFSTYQMFEKGMDVPRLNAGIDISPRSSATQVHGRILRTKEGKEVPVWVTILDYNNYRCCYQFAKRVGEYLNSNAEVFRWQRELDEPVKADPKKLLSKVSRQLKSLKHAKVIRRLDGNYTLKTGHTGKG